MEEAKLIKSEKNKDMILFENFSYRLNKPTKSNSKWRCSIKSCKGRGKAHIHYENYEFSFQVNIPHNHAANPRDCLKSSIFLLKEDDD